MAHRVRKVMKGGRMRASDAKVLNITGKDVRIKEV